MAGANFESRHAGNFVIGGSATAVALPSSGFETIVVFNPSTTATIWFTDSGTAVIPADGVWGSGMRAVAPGTVQAFSLGAGAADLSLISSSGSVTVNLAVGRGQ